MQRLSTELINAEDKLLELEKVVKKVSKKYLFYMKHNIEIVSIAKFFDCH